MKFKQIIYITLSVNQSLARCFHRNELNSVTFGLYFYCKVKPEPCQNNVSLPPDCCWTLQSSGSVLSAAHRTVSASVHGGRFWVYPQLTFPNTGFKVTNSATQSGARISCFQHKSRLCFIVPSAVCLTCDHMLTSLFISASFFFALQCFFFTFACVNQL